MNTSGYAVTQSHGPDRLALADALAAAVEAYHDAFAHTARCAETEIDAAIRDQMSRHADVLAKARAYTAARKGQTSP